MYKRVGATIAVAVAAMLSPSSIAEAAGASADHCVQRVISQRSSGELVLSAPRCYRTFDQAMQAEGVTAWGEGASVQAARSGVSVASFTLATHYDWANFNAGGGTTSTVGGACSGGWINTVPAWNNRISSTLNGCPTVRHFDGANLTGQMQSTTGLGGNLFAMDNRTSSIQYT